MEEWRRDRVTQAALSDLKADETRTALSVVKVATTGTIEQMRFYAGRLDSIRHARRLIEQHQDEEDET